MPCEIFLFASFLPGEFLQSFFCEKERGAVLSCFAFLVGGWEECQGRLVCNRFLLDSGRFELRASFPVGWKGESPDLVAHLFEMRS